MEKCLPTEVQARDNLSVLHFLCTQIKTVFFFFPDGGAGAKHAIRGQSDQGEQARPIQYFQLHGILV